MLINKRFIKIISRAEHYADLEEFNLKPLNVFAFVALTIIVFFILIIAKELLIPMFLAVFIWYLINVLALTIRKVKLFKLAIPSFISYIISITGILSILFFVINLISSNIAQVVAASSLYEKNIERFIMPANQFLSEYTTFDIKQMVQDINISSIITQIASGLTGIISNTGLVILYIFFLFFEQKYVPKKIAAMLPEKKRHDEIMHLIRKIGSDIMTYLGIKTLVSILTALLGYMIMSFVGLDFAAFWAFLIFLFNYIPNIGSLVATLLPALLALVQFDTLKPFFIILFGITSIQLIVANIIEPRLMGQSLNLSPLVIVLSLVVWGTIWGIPGMFFCVPLTVIMMIIFLYFPKTRPVAIMLSKSGSIV